MNTYTFKCEWQNAYGDCGQENVIIKAMDLPRAVGVLDGYCSYALQLDCHYEVLGCTGADGLVHTLDDVTQDDMLPNHSAALKAQRAFYGGA